MYDTLEAYAFCENRGALLIINVLDHPGCGIDWFWA